MSEKKLRRSAETYPWVPESLPLRYHFGMNTSSNIVLPRIVTLAWLLFVGFSCGYAQDSAKSLIDAGMGQFQSGEIKNSIASFEAAEKLDPTVSPYLWQLGISRYYAKQFEQGRKQFELHKRVNPNDVENATWHFLCVAKSKDLGAARKLLIPLDTARDTRVPMTEIYDFYAGRVTFADVMKAAKASPRPSAMMYANLYLGLYYEVVKQDELAKKFLRLAADAKLDNHYMHDVARVHVKLRGWDKEVD